MKLSVYDGARWVSISPHAFSHAIGGKDELIPEDIGAASTLFVEDEIAAHLGEADPHPQYLTQVEGDTLYAGASAVSTHLAASDPHPQYLTQVEGDTLYAGASAISTHLAASDPHPQYLTQVEGDTLYAPNNTIASHLSAQNPHQITPTLIGAAAATHTHTGSQISGNISGNAANVTGVVAIANGGTGASTAATALASLGAAAASHTHSNLNQINTFSASNLSNQIGVPGNCIFLFLNFHATWNTWINIANFTQAARVKVMLLGCVLNNWEGGKGIMHGWKECDLSGNSVGSIPYQSVNLLLRLNESKLQASAQGLYTNGRIQFQGILLCYGY